MLTFSPSPPLVCVQGEPRNGFCGAGGFRHLQQGFALLQRQVEPGPATDVGGVRCVGHVCAPARWFPGQRKWKPASYWEVGGCKALQQILKVSMESQIDPI